MTHRIKARKIIAQESTRSSYESILLLFPLLLIATVLPLLVKVHQYDSPLTKYDWYSNLPETYDYFLYYKQWFFVGMCTLLLIVLIGRAIYNKEHIRFIKTLLPLFVYALFALASTLFSKDLIIGLTGNTDQFENIFCLLGYVLIVFYCSQIIKSESELKILIMAVAIGALIIGIIGTFQALGYDFFQSQFGQQLISDPGQTVKSNFEEGFVYTTMYNPNYVGVYNALIIPIFTVLLLYCKKISEFVLYSLVVITSIISLFGSRSKAGFISVIITLLVAVILLRREVIKKWFILLPLITLGVISFIIINHINGSSYSKALLSTITNSSKNETTQPSLTSIETKKDYVEIVYKNNTLRASLNSSGDLILKDNRDETIPYSLMQEDPEALILTIGDIRFADIFPILYLKDVVEFGFLIDETLWAFHYDEVTQQYLYYNRYGNFSPIITPETALFTGNESFASGRGYIWSRTIPLLKNYFFLGSGADTFVQNFTQYDYVGFHNYNYENIIISKPHNLYLQVGIQTGVVSLLALIAFFLLFIIQSIKLYFNHKFDTLASQIGISCFLGVLAFLIVSITNDSTISVTPIFWLIVGVGYVANHIVRLSQTNTTN